MTTSPVTVLVTRCVLRERAREFEQLIADMQVVVRNFPGHMAGLLIPPEHAEESSYRMLFVFDNDAHLQSWMQSHERQRWLQHIDEISQAEAATRVLTSMEAWFVLPATRTKVPPRWKMALVTLIGIYPLVLLMSYTVAPMLNRYIAAPIASLCVIGVIITAMTWIVLPLLVRLFANWLYPATPELRANSKSTSDRP